MKPKSLIDAVKERHVHRHGVPVPIGMINNCFCRDDRGHCAIPFGVEVEQDKVEASFGNDVLTVTLPKTEKAQAQVKRIAIKS